MFMTITFEQFISILPYKFTKGKSHVYGYRYVSTPRLLIILKICLTRQLVMLKRVSDSLRIWTKLKFQLENEEGPQERSKE